MPARPASAKKSKAKSKSKKKDQTNDEIDPRQEQINNLIREREEIRSKFNAVCSKLIENVNIDDYPRMNTINQEQPCDLPLENLLNMVDDICYYRSSLLELYQENEDRQKIPVARKISQLARDEPDLFRKFLTNEQRLSFVIRERDLWKENAQTIQIMYATIVDQLEMGAFKKVNRTNDEILHSHRLKIEDVCRIFSAARVRPLRNIETNRLIKNESQEKPTTNQSEQRTNPRVNKRRVSFADQIDIIATETTPEKIEEKQIIEPIVTQENSVSVVLSNQRASARETSIEEMEPNLRMLIIKELSKDAHQERPPSRRSALYNRSTSNFTLPLERGYRSLEWVELARLIGIRESEIEHWLSQSLQYPAGRVISTWCHTTSPSPTVADLHRLLRSHQLNRVDLIQSIENMYHVSI